MSGEPAPRILYLANDAGFFISHRLPIAIQAQKDGYDVHLAAPGKCPREVAAGGIRFHCIRLSRSGANPISELRSLVGLVRLLTKIRPQIVHAVTVKPIIYGGLAARLARTPVFVAAIAGLGSVFVSGGRLQRSFVLLLYRLALRQKCVRIIFQNPSDKQEFIEEGVVSSSNAILIKGSGVDIRTFKMEAEPAEPVVFAFAGRLLRHKGIAEFLRAFEILQARKIEAVGWLIGEIDPGNPSSFTQSELERLVACSGVEVLGFRRDIPELLARAHVIVHPSYYREGLPKVLSEAAACGRAAITTDVPGCRDAIIANETGLLVPARDAVALADAMEKLACDPLLRRRMGAAARHLAEREYAIETIVNQHLALYRSLQQ